MKLPRITGLVGLQSDGKGTVTFQLKSNDGRSHYIPMQIGVINALLGPILNIKQEMGEGITEIGGIQMIALTGVRPAIDEEGLCVLELNLDGLPLRVTVPRSGLPAFRNALAELEQLAETVAKGTRH